MSEEALKVELLSVSEAQDEKTAGTLTASIDKQLDELSEIARDVVVNKVIRNSSIQADALRIQAVIIWCSSSLYCQLGYR